LAVPHASPIELVLVDFDDTLVDTAPRFQRARRELFELLESLGFDAELVRRTHHDEIDPVMRERFGLGPQRLEHAFRHTYEHLASNAAMALDESVAERCAWLGRTVAGTPPLLNGALDALRRLAHALPTVLYTQAGDVDYQLSCIAECGVLDVVQHERVRIASAKTTEQFRAVLEEFGVSDPARAWMIGNSMRSDINPALAVGAHAIYVEVDEPWEFDVVDPLHDNFHRVRSFPEAVDLLLSGVWSRAG
jgi:putative hydrolase of the HAD superfamily